MILETWPYDDKLIEWRNGYKKREALKKTQKDKEFYDYDGTLLDTGISEDGKKDKKNCGMMSEVLVVLIVVIVVIVLIVVIVVLI